MIRLFKSFVARPLLLLLSLLLLPLSASAENILSCYTGQNYTGTACTNYGLGHTGGYMNTLTSAQLNNSIRSFKLKQGYMVTFAVGTSGWGYSRCFVAADSDLEMSSLPAVLDGKISSYRIFEWQNVKKNGLSGDISKEINDALGSSWCFAWGPGEDRRPNQECVPHKIHKNWPGVAELGAKDYAAHMKTDNEPANSSDDTPASVAEVLAYWQDAMRTGMRLCSPSTHDGGYTWLKEFITEIDKRGWRCDVVDIHCYWDAGTFNGSALANTYNTYKRPIWISELLWGASWSNNGIFSAVSDPSSCSDANQQKNLDGAKPILTRLNSLSYVERYAWWNGEQPASRVYYNGALTKLGQYYKSMNAGGGYQRNMEFVPTVVISKPEPTSMSIDGTTATFSWNDSNGDMIDAILIQGRSSDGSWTTLKTIAPRDKNGSGKQAYTESVTVPSTDIDAYRIVNIFDNTEYATQPMSHQSASGWITTIPNNYDDFYYIIYSDEAATDLCWTLGWNGNTTDISYQTPKTWGTDLSQAWQIEKNGEGYALRNMEAYDYVMCSPYSWNFNTNNNSYHIGNDKSCYLPEYHGSYWTLKNLGHTNCYVGLWDNDKKFAAGERLAANRDNTTTADHLRIYAINKLEFNQTFLSPGQDATHMLLNPYFTWGTTNDGGNGINTHPNNWTFAKNTSGWNDHNVASETINGVSTQRFNSWAGTFRYAELSQSVKALPNGIYRLTADLATTEGNTRNISKTAIYGAPANADYIGRSYNIEGCGVSEFRPYEVTLQIDDNQMNVGVRSDGCWFKVANFRLTYLGESINATTQQQREVTRGRALQRWFFGQTQGDVNLDLHTTISDVTTLLDIIRGNQPDYGTADQNADNILNLEDVDIIKSNVLK